MSQVFYSGDRSSASASRGSSAAKRPPSSLIATRIQDNWQSQPFEQRLAHHTQDNGSSSNRGGPIAQWHPGTAPGAPGRIQPKLRINPPNDRFEQEADRVANRVAQASPSDGPAAAADFSSAGRGAIQAKCADCESKDEKKRIQRKGSGDAAPTSHGTPMSGIGTSGGGMNPQTRTFMERHIGHDFSGVRIHTDTRAAESAQAINARAYTVGRDIVFGAGEYRPETTDGRRLLAHELTHVVQQQGAANGMVQRRQGIPCDQNDRQSGDDTYGHDILQTDYIFFVNPGPGKREYGIPHGTKSVLKSGGPKQIRMQMPPLFPIAPVMPPLSEGTQENDPEATGIDREPDEEILTGKPGTETPANPAKGPVKPEDLPMGFADIVDTNTLEIYDFKPDNPKSQNAGKKEVEHYVNMANLNCPQPGRKWIKGHSYPNGAGSPESPRRRVVKDPGFPELEWAAQQHEEFRNDGVIAFWPRRKKRDSEPESHATPEQVQEIGREIEKYIKTPRQHPDEIKKRREKKRTPSSPPGIVDPRSPKQDDKTDDDDKNDKQPKYIPLIPVEVAEAEAIAAMVEEALVAIVAEIAVVVAEIFAMPVADAVAVVVLILVVTGLIALPSGGAMAATPHFGDGEGSDQKSAGSEAKNATSSGGPGGSQTGGSGPGGSEAEGAGTGGAGTGGAIGTDAGGPSSNAPITEKNGPIAASATPVTKTVSGMGTSPTGIADAPATESKSSGRSRQDDIIERGKNVAKAKGIALPTGTSSNKATTAAPETTLPGKRNSGKPSTTDRRVVVAAHVNTDDLKPLNTKMSVTTRARLTDVRSSKPGAMIRVIFQVYESASKYYETKPIAVTVVSKKGDVATVTYHGEPLEILPSYYLKNRGFTLLVHNGDTFTVAAY